MALPAGTHLGPYEVIAALGAGGMGEVYTARDTRLGRTVAVKVLSPAYAPSPEARARLKREARTLSQLSHPNICALYDVGEAGEIDYLVMEVLEGETLAARLRQGALPLAQALQFAIQMAEALDKAHRAGIAHRDLKPANVMLTRSGVKLLDFGLATPIPMFQAASADTASLQLALTAQGTVVGTLQYMAPEQLAGRPADARSDIFALGAVLFEMATGSRAFSGDSAAAIAASILSKDIPAVSTINPLVPPAFDRLVSLCLMKEPDGRWQSAHDVALLARAIVDDDRGAPRPTAPKVDAVRRWAPWMVAAIALVVAATEWAVPAAPAAPVARAITFPVPPPDGGSFASFENVEMAVSPDGNQIAFVASDAAGTRRLWLRPLAAADPAPLRGTEGATSVFWSPDGRSLGFFAGSKLKRFDLGATAPATLCDTETSAGYFGSWGADGQILFASLAVNAGIMRISSGGGTPVIERAPDKTHNERRLQFPTFLPDGRRYLYLVRTMDFVSDTLTVGATGQPGRAIMPLASNAQYVEPGYLVYAREGSLLARRFDLATAQATGDPVVIADPVSYFSSTANAHFSASASGVLAYQGHSDTSHLAWFSRAGDPPVRASATGGYLDLRLSEDGRTVLFSRAVPGNGTFDLWRLDLSRGVESQETAYPGNEISPLWVPHQHAIVFGKGPHGPPHMVLRDESGGVEHPLLPGDEFQDALDVTADGEWLAYSQRKLNGEFGLFVLRLSGAEPRTSSAAFDGPGNRDQARFSPDGRALAYTSDHSGKMEVYVAPFPAARPIERVSTDGGSIPRWSRDGRELLYRSSDKRLMSAPMDQGRPSGTPTTVLTMPPGSAWTGFEIAPDGRFLAIVPESFANRQPMTVIVNWTARLR